MRTILIFALLSPIALSAVEILGVDYAQPDKRAHATIGAVLAGVSALVVQTVDPDAPYWRKVAWSMVAPAIFGVGKELSDMTDSKRHTADWRDCAATLQGGLVVSLTLCVRF